jgi:hypothetical protein
MTQLLEFAQFAEAENGVIPSAARDPSLASVQDAYCQDEEPRIVSTPAAKACWSSQTSPAIDTKS